MAFLVHSLFPSFVKDMTIAHSSLLSLNFLSFPHKKPIPRPIPLYSNLPSSSIQCSTNKKDFPLPAGASISYPSTNMGYLESEFSGQGVTFSGIGDDIVVTMSLKNGSEATLMLPSGLITSYKAPMWHGSTVELLHTMVSEADSGGAVIQGGMSLAFKCESEGMVSWSPSTWDLHQVSGSPQEYTQVELRSRNSEGKVEVRHIVTLKEDLLSSEIVISNSQGSSLYLVGSLISHLAVSTPEATYAVGLEGSDFFNRPPILSNFSIIPPEFGQRKGSGSWKLWDPMAFTELFSRWGGRNQNQADDGQRMEKGEELEGEEKENYKHLTEEMSRIYTSAPRNFTIIDRGRRNSVDVGRYGFNELYMFSPGSSYEWYGKFAYMCIGHSALLEPIILHPKAEWRGGQQLYNPNI